MGALEQAIDTALAGADPYVEGIQASGETISASRDLGFFEFHNMELEQCVLSGIQARKASFYDCTLRGCDLSGAHVEEAYFARTRLLGCKLEGTQLTKSFWRKSRLVDCVCRYANWGESTLEDTLLRGCDLREAFLSEVSFRTRTKLEHCDLTRADFFRTPLGRMDFSTCNIAGIAVSDTRSELRGLTISAEQAVDLVGLLGVHVSEL